MVRRSKKEVIMAWKYKVCKQHIKSSTYTVVSRHGDKREAERDLAQFATYDREHRFFIKRYSDMEA